MGSFWVDTLKNKVFYHYTLQGLNTHAADGFYLATGKVAKSCTIYCA